MTQIDGKTAQEGDEPLGLTPSVLGPMGEPTGAAGVSDSMLNTAYMFEAQLEQMTAWKHQLSQQMELLRRDGVKLLERQKNLAVERQRLAAERETLTGDRAYVQKLHAEVEEQTKRLAAEGERIAQGLAELETLEAQKTQWEGELAGARMGAAAAIQEAELARQRKADFEAAVAGADARLAEVRDLQARRGDLELQVAAAETTLTGLRGEMETVEGQRRELRLKEQEFAERERGVKQREANEAENRQNSESARREQEDRMERERQAIAEARAEIVRDRGGLAERMRELETARAQAEALALEVGEGAQRDRAEADEKMAEVRAALEEMNAVRSGLEQRRTALEVRAGELAAAQSAAAATVRELAEREEKLSLARREGEEAQGRLQGQQEALLGAERLLSEKIAAAEGELAGKLAAAETAKQQADAERETLAKQRLEIEKKLDLMEGELADQFEAVAKQTKRLTERRADVEARSAGVDQEVDVRIARVTESLREELVRAQKTYEERVRVFKEQVDKTEAAAVGFKTREAELERTAAAAVEEAAALQRELARVNEDLSEASRGRMEQTEIAAQQVSRFEREAADWQRRLEQAVAAAGENRGLQQAAAEADAARRDIESLTVKLEEALAAREELQDQLAAQAARGTELEKLAEGLVAKLGAAEGEIAALKQEIETAARRRPDAPVGETDAPLKAAIVELKKQVEMLELQREDLVGQLFGVQDELRRRAEEGLLAKNGMEAELVELRARSRRLEAEKTEAAAPPIGEPPISGTAGHTDVKLSGQRGRLLRQARALRAYRKQVADTKGALARSGEELARQREQLRSRKENLEQVKRLLEKQELVMARKLADHNALKTVAAVGIFLIMILGSVFFGVYKFATPMFKSEAIVQLAPPEQLKGAEVKAWLTRQMELIRSPEVTFAAWKVLRGDGEHYGMHDVREEWVASLPQHLTMQLDGDTRRLSIQYVGQSALGVSQVCNALAEAYVTPASRDGGDANGMGARAAILAKAEVPGFPSQDSRLMLSLSLSAVALFVSLLLVIVFRHYVARQLREIDRMADEQDLADLKGEMA